MHPEKGHSTSLGAAKLRGQRFQRWLVKHFCCSPTDFAENVVAEGRDIITPKRAKPGKDLYIWILAAQSLTFFFLVFFSQSGDKIVDGFKESAISWEYVSILFLNFVFIILDRIIYLYRSVAAKFVLQWGTLVAVVILLHNEGPFTADASILQTTVHRPWSGGTFRHSDLRNVFPSVPSEVSFPVLNVLLTSYYCPATSISPLSHNWPFISHFSIPSAVPSCTHAFVPSVCEFFLPWHPSLFFLGIHLPFFLEILPPSFRREWDCIFGMDAVHVRLPLHLGDAGTDISLLADCFILVHPY
jgi:hypothetical protein